MGEASGVQIEAKSPPLATDAAEGTKQANRPTLEVEGTVSRRRRPVEVVGMVALVVQVVTSKQGARPTVRWHRR